MILWIILGYLGAALFTFRFWSMPKERKIYLDKHKEWQVRYDRGHTYLNSEPHFLVFLTIAILLALTWPVPALYKLLWPKGIDYKIEKEKLKEKLKADAEAAVKEAERIAREFGLNNPKD